jgi:hypothetical protein
MNQKIATSAEDFNEHHTGGVTIRGNAEIHGDVTGHDKIVHGDEVRGDKIEGDKIEAQVSAVGSGGQVAIGKEIRQSIVEAPVDLTAAERVELDGLLVQLRHQLAESDIPENKKAVGQEFARQLEKELTRTDKPPDSSVIKVAGKWLLENIPALTGALTSLFLSPVVGKIVEAAGDIAADWVKEQFGRQT